MPRVAGVRSHLYSLGVTRGLGSDFSGRFMFCPTADVPGSRSGAKPGPIPTQRRLSAWEPVSCRIPGGVQPRATVTGMVVGVAIGVRTALGLGAMEGPQG